MLKYDGIKVYSNKESLDALAATAAQVGVDDVIVEIGVYQGGSLRRIAEATTCTVYGVDTWGLEGAYASGSESPEKYGIENMTKAQAHTSDLPNVVLVRDFSVAAAYWWDGPTIGMLYIDGEHTYDSVMDDVAAWSVHLAPDAFVVFDDYRMRNEPVKRAVDELISEGLLTKPVVHGDRLAVTNARF